jgi:hypothetical protein
MAGCVKRCSVRTLGIVIAAAAGVFGFSACDASTKPSAQVGINAGVKFAQCMRAHGVSDFPDPGTTGGPQETPVSSAPAFVGAQKACGGGPGGPGLPQPTEAQKIHAIAFAKCMRTHGVPNWPDPRYGPPSNPTTTVLAIHGMAFVFPPGLSLQSPALRQSASECGFKLPIPRS